MTKKRTENTSRQKANDAGQPKPARRKRNTTPAQSADTAPHAPITQDNATPSTQTAMEVHHHPQLEHKPKPWKEYLLEGFMIFVAVMMGFIAENIREAITNHEHVKQLTTQLVQDLRSDTAQLNEDYRGEKGVLENNDTIFSLLKKPIQQVDMKDLQWSIARSHNLWLFHSAGGAIAAIKNELHLEQFSNSKIISYISSYEGHIELLHTIQDITLQYQRNMLEPFSRAHFTPDNLYAVFHYDKHISADVRNLKQEDLTQLRADMVLIRINTKELMDKNRQLYEDADTLLKYVIQKYDLKDQ